MLEESKLVFIFGYSGHAYVIIESLLDAGYTIGGYFDFEEASKNPYQLTYMGFEKNVDVKALVQNHLVFPTVGENSIREKLIQLFDSLHLHQFVAADPTAKISKTARIGDSTYIGKNVIVNAQSTIGRGVILNTQATIEHECVVQDFAHIAPAAVLCGSVEIGKNSFVGANAVIRQNIFIAPNVIVGAGSVVVKSIHEKGTWAGNPSFKI